MSPLTPVVIAMLSGIGAGSSTDKLAVIHFSTDSAEIADAARPELAATMRWLDAHPDHLVYVEGYADRRGGSAANLELSYERSRAVRDELVRRGADPFRLIVSAHGEDRDLAGKAPSRSVVVRGSGHAYDELLEAQRAPTPPSYRPPRPPTRVPPPPTRPSS